MNFLDHTLNLLSQTLRDVIPLIGVILFFQLCVIRKKIDQAKKMAYGFVLVIFGLAIFSVGLDQGLFPLGEAMIEQLTDIQLLTGRTTGEMTHLLETSPSPFAYYWTYLFAFLIGFSTTIAEPALIAVSIKAEEISTGGISALGLRFAVALGVGIGLVLGCYRIVTGTHIVWFIILGYLSVIIQTYFAPRMIIPLAYDSGGVTTSTVTVPLVASLGIGLATHVPGRSILIDAFGLIAFASLFPIITVLAYATIAEYIKNRRMSRLQK